MRLKSGSSDAEGRVEVCVNSRWGSVCRGGAQSWDNNDAQVVCRQLGFNMTETSEFEYYVFVFWAASAFQVILFRCRRNTYIRQQLWDGNGPHLPQ